jgi:hypothetical protein
VRYQADEAIPDFEYGYDDALRDGGVVRPIYFPAVGGVMEWSASDGVVYAASFEDPLRTALANQRLRTALSLESDWECAASSQGRSVRADRRLAHLIVAGPG